MQQLPEENFGTALLISAEFEISRRPSMYPQHMGDVSLSLQSRKASWIAGSQQTHKLLLEENKETWKGMLGEVPAFVTP